VDVKIINPFLAATIHVLKTMADITPVASKPFLKKDATAIGDVTAIIGITGAAKGSMSLSFSESSIKAIVAGLIGTPVDDLNDEVKDAVGELTNMISGDARRRLSEESISLQGGIPTIISGRGHTVRHIHNGPCIAIPFETPFGGFIVEIAFSSD
jgi:chemotaxis protein CheX